MYFKKPLIRVCNWDRQTGKSTFIFNDAISRLTGNDNAGALFVSPDRNTKSQFTSKFIKNQIPDSITSRITNYTASEFKRLYSNLGLNFGKYYVYLDDINYSNISFEQLMLNLNFIKNNLKVSKFMIITFTGSLPRIKSVLEKAEELIRTENQWIKEWEEYQR